MQIKFLNKKANYKKFNYSPRYYDERKERLELKKAQFNRITDENIPDEERHALLRTHMKENWSRAQHAQQQKSTSNVRILLLIAALLVLGYFVFNGLDDVDVVVKKLS